MRITTLLIGIQACFATVLLASTLKAQTINLDEQQVNVKQVFTSIEKQTEVTFIYDEKMLQGLNKINIKVSNKPLADVLKTISTQLPLQFKQAGNVIGVSRISIKSQTKESVLESPPSSPLPPIKISGKILGAKGLPLAGVSITVKETKNAAISDENGLYTIVAESNQTLVFSYVGFKKQQININGRSQIDITFEEEMSALDDVHIIAYGTTTQRLSTGSISKVTAAEIEEQPVGNPLAALEGRVPGMIVTQSNGVPGSSFTVQVQGQNALVTGQATNANSSPLFIIDGIPFAPNNNSISQIHSAANGLSPFNSINPADIESIEVLKDADATAIYGSRGAYGVILITTKKGKSGKTQVTVNMNSGISGITRMPDYLNTQQYVAMREEAFKNDGVVPNINTAPDLFLFDTTKYTNWKKVLIGNTAHTTDAEVSLSGGNENTQFFMNGGYHNETTVLPGSQGDKRASFHFNLTHSSPDKKFHVALSASYSADNNSILVSDLTGQIDLPPDYPSLLDAGGNLIWQYKGTSLENVLGNPLAYLKETYLAQTNNLIGSLQLSYLLLKGLTLKTSLGYNTININEVTTEPSFAQDPLYGSLGSASFGNNMYSSYILEPQIEYTKNIYKGKLDILGGGSWQQIINNSTLLAGYNYSSDNLLQSISSAGSVSASNQYSQYRYEAYFTRINYNLSDKYILDLTGRRDGSSRFGPGRQFANFGALGTAWVFTNEQFAKDNFSFLSFGKLRGSYGITGSDQIGDYQYLDSWTTTTNPFQGVQGLKPTRLYNPDYGWEVNKKLSVALDLGFFNDRILISADYYRNRSDNHLLSVSLPSQTGFGTVLENFPALVQNRGFDFVVSTKNITAKNFGWNTSINLTIPQNKLLKFDNTALASYTYVVGQPLSLIKGSQVLGVSPSTGVLQYSASDEVVLGNLDPKFYGGLSNNFHYKSLSLDIFFEFKKQLGINELSDIYNVFNQPGGIINEPVSVLSRWQNQGDQTTIQKFTATYGSPAQTAAALYTTSLSDASYIRLKNLYLSYILPSLWMKHLQVTSCRIFLQGQNLLTFTKYLGSDPETQNLQTLPPLKTIALGIQLNL